MPEQQQDFFEKMGEKSEAQNDIEKGLEIRNIAREVIGGLKSKDSIKKTVKEVLAKHGKGLENLEAICNLVENTMLDDGGKDTDYWKR